MKRLRGNEILEVIGTGRGKNAGIRRCLRVHAAGSIRKSGEQVIKGDLTDWGSVKGYITENKEGKIELRISNGEHYYGAQGRSVGYRLSM